MTGTHTTSLAEDACRAHECRCSEPLVYKVEQVSELLNLGLNQVYEGIRRGEIPSVKVGRRILVPRQKLLDMLNGGAGAP